jgi:hypothetical protein
MSVKIAMRQFWAKAGVGMATVKLKKGAFFDTCVLRVWAKDPVGLGLPSAAQVCKVPVEK